MKAKEDSVSGLTAGIEFLFKKNGVQYVKGTGTLVGEHEIKVAPIDGGEELSLKAKNIIIATGSEATPFPGMEIDEKRIVTSTGAIALTEVPKKMVVIGGGIIGLEMVGGTYLVIRSWVADKGLTGIRVVSSRFRSYRCGIPWADWWTRHGYRDGQDDEASV